MIKSLTLDNFTVFEHCEFTLGKAVNVIIGENGTGKTHVLKVLYALLSALNKSSGKPEIKPEHFLMETLSSVFKIDRSIELITLKKRLKKKEKKLSADIMCSFDENGVEYSLPEIEIEENKDVFSLSSKGHIPSFFLEKKGNVPLPLFLPSRELLTIYPNYQSLSKHFNLPYDSTYDDTISLLGLPYLKQVPEIFTGIVKELEKAIDGKIYLKNEKFFFHPNQAADDTEWDINLTAEGWRKLGMILQLLNNGGLNKHTCLFWDEPEANLNPKLIRLIANIIVKLGEFGIQSFITTHSLFLLRELDMLVKSNQKIKDDVRYFNFPKPGIVEQGNSPEDLGDILILDESLEQSQRFLQMED